MKCWARDCSNEIGPTSPDGRPKYYCCPDCGCRERERLRGAKGKRECACGCARIFSPHGVNHRFYNEECALKGGLLTEAERHARELAPITEEEQAVARAAESVYSRLVLGEESLALWFRCLNVSA